MRLYALIIAVFIFYGAAGEALGSARIYLYPRVDLKDGLCLGDIATIETNDDDLDALAGLIVKNECLTDGYLDSREINDLVRSTGIPCMIYGSAVRIVNPSTEEQPAGQYIPLIKKGDHVTVISVRGRIRIELAGIAMCDGMKGDDVSVRTRGRSVLTGRVVDRKTLEAGL